MIAVTSSATDDVMHGYDYHADSEVEGWINCCLFLLYFFLLTVHMCRISPTTQWYICVSTTKQNRRVHHKKQVRNIMYLKICIA